MMKIKVQIEVEGATLDTEAEYALRAAMAAVLNRYPGRVSGMDSYGSALYNARVLSQTIYIADPEPKPKEAA